MERRGAKEATSLYGLLLALAAVSTSAPQLSLNTLPKRLELGSHMECLRDPSRRLTLADVRGAHATAFRPCKGTPNFGLTRDAGWFRLRIRSKLPVRQLTYLDMRYVILDRVEVYVATTRDRGRQPLARLHFARHLFGDTVSPSSRMPVPSYTLPLTFEPGQGKLLYVRVVTDGALQLPISLFSPHAYVSSMLSRLLLYGPIIGLLFMLLVYDLFLFAMVRDYSYLEFAGCVFFAMTYVLHLSGIAQTYLLGENLWLSNMGYVISMVGVTTFMFAFTRRFLGLRERLPRAHRLLGLLLLISLLLYPLALLAGYRITLLAVVAVAVIGACCALITGILSLRRGYKPARFYVLGWSAFFVGILVFAAQKLGLFSVNLISDNAAILGFIGTVVVLPMGLADRINLLQEQRQQVQQRALELKNRMAADLEAEVARKTDDLRVANRELAEGNERLQQEIEQRSRAEEERQALERRLFESQKLDAVGRLAGGVAHDVNNILATISNTASGLAQTLPPRDERREEIDDLLAAARRGGELAHNLLGFARRGQYRREPLDLHRAIDEMHRLLRRMIPSGIEIELQLAAALRPVEGDISQLGQVLVNLAVNAAQAMGDKGTLTVRTENLDLTESSGELAPGRYVRLEVCDTGPGMDEETRARAFEPFFTTKAPGEGTGLGLSMVYGAVQTHHGQVTVDSAPGEGTIVRVTLPAYEGAAPPVAPRPPSDDSGPPCSGLVLLVDDERLLRRSASRLLKRLGCKVLEAEEGQHALELYNAHRDEIEVVVLDLVMPVMDGFETFRRLRQLEPGLPIVLSSGYSPEGAAEELLAQPAVAFVQKPYDTDELITAIAQTQPRPLTACAS
jgi:signal transduction histidine kinase/CheY-like chemotaxis protein